VRLRSHGPHGLYNRWFRDLPAAGVAVLHPLCEAEQAANDLEATVRAIIDAVALLRGRLLKVGRVSERSSSADGLAPAPCTPRVELIVGWSMGGAAVLEAAAQIARTSLRSDRKVERGTGVELQVRASVPERAPIPRDGSAAARYDESNEFAPKDSDDNDLPSVRLAGIATIATQTAGIEGTVLGAVRFLAARGRVPLLFCHGTRDASLSPACSEMCADAAGARGGWGDATATLLLMDGDGHGCRSCGPPVTQFVLECAGGGRGGEEFC
jgi:pimeloyl-ACP methyl ester carboxylesterase